MMNKQTHNAWQTSEAIWHISNNFWRCSTTEMHNTEPAAQTIKAQSGENSDKSKKITEYEQNVGILVQMHYSISSKTPF